MKILLHLELLVYTRKISPRVEYTFRFIFKDILRLNYRVTTSITEAQSYMGPLISYSHQRIGRSIQIVPHGLLCEVGIKKHSFEVLNWGNLPAFPLTSPDADIPFDIFTASFFLISRYEEYFNLDLDKHRRFKSSNSIAAKHNFLHLPIVDLWAFKLLQLIKDHNYAVTCKPRHFNSIVTVDLDSAYAIKDKGMVRSSLGMLKSILLFRGSDFLNRIRVHLGFKPDPFDIYNELISILPQMPQSIWFIHTGRWSKYDKSIPVYTASMRNLLRIIVEKFKVGLHPSYSSFLNEPVIKDELATLVGIIDQSVSCSRQHYIRLGLPTTYRQLVRLGITEDYSMGYPDVSGFRAGTCTPFIFYDLMEDTTLNIKVFPFQVMDSTLVAKHKLNPQQSMERVKQFIDSVKMVEGTFISVWHVDYLSGYGYKYKWLQTLEYTINYLKSIGDQN